MRFVALMTAAALVGSAMVHAQSGGTRPAPTNGRYVAIGCLSRQGTGAAARYVVTDRRGEKPTTYRLQGDSGLLARHVGHTVEVAGPLASSAQLTLHVQSLVWIASSCK